MPRIVFSIYLWLFFLDGSLSLADDVTQHLYGSFFLSPLRNILATLAFVGSFFLLPAVILSPRFPKRLLLPPVLFLVWANACNAFPLNLYSYPLSGLWLSVLQFLSAVALLFFFREPGSFKPRHFALARPAFTWKNTLISTGLVLFCGLLILPLCLSGQLVSFISNYTGGYLQVHHDGLYLTERHFQKENRELRLISMMHIGRKEFYEALTKDFPTKSRGVVLLEGITNHQKLKTPDLGYEKMAKTFGLTSQAESDFAETARLQLEQQEKHEPKTSPLDFRSADIDLSDFDPKTLEFINLVGAAYRSKNSQELLRAFNQLNRSFPSDESIQPVLKDILDLRNDHLFGVIEQSLKDYEVVLVPWGALHLPEIESRALALGYKQTFSTERKVLSFW